MASHDDARHRVHRCLGRHCQRICSSARIDSGPIRRTRTTPAATRRPRAARIDPVTGRPVELLWVKGSGGDLGTLTEAGLAVLRLDRLRSLVDVYPGVEQEDEMVAAFDHCLFGRGGAAPSIDTAMHGLVDAAHVDHLHPDGGIAFATAADGEALTRQAFGDRVAWTPWRRPGFQLGLDIAAIRRERPDAIGVILGGHGITAWGATSDGGRAEFARDHPDRGAVHRRARPAGAARRCGAGARGAARTGATGARRRTLPVAPRAGVDGSPAGGPLHRQRRRPRLRRPRGDAPARRARDVLPRPLPAHEGAAARRRPARVGAARRARRADPRAPRGLPRRVRAPTTNAMRRPTRRRCAVPTRRSSSFRASACSASGRTSRPPGSPASSTSTRST